MVEREQRPQQYEYTSSTYGALAPDEQQRFLDSAHDIALDGFGWEDKPGKREETEGILKSGRQIVASVDGNPVGFISTIHYPIEAGGVMYVDGVVIRQAYKKSGIAKELSERAMAELRNESKDVTLVAGITQNPKVAQLRASYSSAVYPIDYTPSEDILDVALLIQSAKGWGGTIEPDTLILRDFYEGEEMERSASIYPIINDFFDAHVGRYDGIFIIGKTSQVVE